MDSKNIKPRNLALVGSILVILSVVGLFTWLHKTVQVVIDGKSYSFTAFAITVQDVLRTAQISLAEADNLSLSPSAWLKEGEVISLDRAVQVPILSDDKITIILTTDKTPASILKQAGIQLQPGDYLLANGQAVSLDTPLKKKLSGEIPALQVRRAIPYTLLEGDHSQALHSTASLLGDALWEAGVQILSSDKLTPGFDNPLKPGLEARITRSRSVSITSDGGMTQVKTSAATVGEALTEAGFTLQSLDYSLPDEKSPLAENGQIQVIRVTEEVTIEQTSLPFEDLLQPVEDLAIDQKQVVQPGEFGIQAKRIRVRYEDGVEISREVEDEWLAREPKARILGYGTKIVPLTVDTPDRTITYWRALSMYAVSYHPSETGSNVTASGMILKKGLVAVDTRYIPFFTRMYVPGYGEAVAADRGGGVIGRMIDLGYTDEEYIPWHQNVTVYFLWPPPENIVWIIP